VSIVLPTAGRTRVIGDRTIDLLVNCVSSVVKKTTYDNYELIIGDDGSLPEAASAYLASVTEVPIRRVSFPQPGGFNYGRKLNFIASHSRASHLLLFNDDTEIISPEWLEAMLEYSQQDAIGGVGAKLLYPDGRIQHMGIVMGVSGMAAHAFHGHPGSTPGYGASAQIVRNYSAVTAACMMTRRELYERLGGFDVRFQFDFNDIDYCLRLRKAGYRLVYTPYAELYHLEMATWGTRPWHAEEVEYMRQTWAEVCERDPYYNPHLTREYPDYRVRV
jgi:GT2 family glycosyltransferase